MSRPLVPVAHASDSVPCRIEGPIEVRITNFGDDLEVKTAFAAPGSSSSSPLYIKSTD